MLYSNFVAERESAKLWRTRCLSVFLASVQIEIYFLALFLSYWHWIERVDELLSIYHATSQKGRDISCPQKYIHLNTHALTLLLLLSQLSYLTRYSRFKIPRGLWFPTRHGVFIVESDLNLRWETINGRPVEAMRSRDELLFTLPFPNPTRP